MFFRSRLIYFAVLLCSLFVGWRFYRYFFVVGKPSIELTDIKSGGYYAGDIQSLLRVKGEYAISEISLWLDEKPLINSFKVGRRVFEREIPIMTKAMTNGKHTLKIEAVDGSYHHNSNAQEIVFHVDNAPLQAAFVNPDADFKVFQGKTLHLQFQVSKAIRSAVIRTLSEEYPCVPEMPGSQIYECFVPVSSETTPTEYVFIIDIEDKVGNTVVLENKFQVVPFPFKRQALAVKKEKILQEEELGLPNDQLKEELKRISAESEPQKLWSGVFYIPCDMTGVSTEFGTVRTSQERGKYAHNAVDLLGKPKSVVWAAQDGKVVLKQRYAISGNTVAIDHGCGVISLYYHLDNFSPIEVGQMIRKGSPVGTLGMTGYASGYHLHWELRIYNIQVDPMQWTKYGF